MLFRSPFILLCLEMCFAHLVGNHISLLTLGYKRIIPVSYTHLYDREALNVFFATLKEEDFEVVVVRSLNEITDDIYDLEEFVKKMCIRDSFACCGFRKSAAVAFRFADQSFLC